MAINQIDKELNDRLMSYANTIARGDRSLEQSLRTHAKNFGEVQEDVVDEYKKHLEKSRTWHGKEAQEAQARLVRLRKLEQEGAKAQQEGINAKIEHNKALKKLDAEQADLTSNVLKLTKTEAARRQAELNQRRNNLNQQFRADTADRTARYRMGMQAAAERRAFENKELSAQAKWGNAFRSLTSNAAQAALKGMFGGASLSGAVANVAKDAYGAIKEGMSTGGYGVGMMPESMGGNAFNVTTMAKFGYNMQEAVKLQAENRRAIISSSNGMKDFVGGMEDAYQKFDFIANPLERSKIAIDSYNIAVKSGIRMSRDQATMFVNDIKKFTKYTGENASEFTKHIGDIMDSQDVQDSLLGAANESQRKAILDSVTAQYTANRAMGMTAEQAKKTAVSLAALENRKGKTVIAQSAKTAAMAAVLGMSKEGAELRRIQMKRQNATAEEKQRAQAIMNEMRNRYDERTRGDVTGAKMGLESVFENLKMDEVLGKEFNTKGVQATSPQEKAFETLPEIPKEIQAGTAKLEEIRTILAKNPLAQIGVGAAGSALSALDIAGGSAGGTLFGNLVSKFIPGLSGAGAAGAGAASSGAAGAGAAGAAGLGAATIGSIVAAVAASGTALYSGYKFAKGEDASNWISNGFDKLTGGWNMFEAFDTLVGGPLSQQEAKIDQMNRTVQGKITPKPNTPVDPVTQKKEDEARKKDDKAQDATQKAEAERVKRERDANEMLKTLSENSTKQVELAEKQLVALALSEQDKGTARANLLKDNRFGSKYGYV